MPGFKDFLVEKISSARDLYVKDLKATDPANLGSSPGGSARSAYDFTYEVVFVNERIAQRLRGETPEKFDFDGWITAPDEFRSVEAAVEGIQSSCDEVLAALKQLPESDLDNVIETPMGASSPAKLAGLCATHLAYHDAQINYIQAVYGDDEMHWD